MRGGEKRRGKNKTAGVSGALAHDVLQPTRCNQPHLWQSGRCLLHRRIAHALGRAGRVGLELVGREALGASCRVDGWVGVFII